MFLSRGKTKKKRTEGTLLTKLNNYGIRVVISGLETLPQENVCLAKPDSMLREPFTMSSCEGLKRGGLWMTTRTGKILSAAWVILL
jgi:hypothetical protein